MSRPAQKSHFWQSIHPHGNEGMHFPENVFARHGIKYQDQHGKVMFSKSNSMRKGCIGDVNFKNNVFTRH